MRKAFIHGPLDVRIDEVPDPFPGPNQVLVRLRRGSLCSSDIGHFRKGTAIPGKPEGFGHDSAGVIEALGDGVTRLAVGEAVTLAGWTNCGACPPCMAGELVRCRARITIPPLYQGWFSEYTIVPEQLAVPLPRGVSIDDGALIEAAYTGINGSRVMGYGAGDLLVLIGAGWMAWGQIAVAAGLGARVVAIARNPARLALAQAFGAEAVFSPDDPALGDQLRDRNGGELPRYLIDSTGAYVPDGLALAQRIGGIGAIIGLMGRKKQVALEEFMFRHQQIRAIAVAPLKPEAVAMIAAGQLDLKPCISHRFPFDALPEAMRFLAEDRDAVTKIMIDFD